MSEIMENDKIKENYPYKKIENYFDNVKKDLVEQFSDLMDIIPNSDIYHTLPPSFKLKYKIFNDL